MKTVGRFPARSFRDLRAWQEALSLACDAERVAACLPRPHFGLADRIRRASVSVQANIAEGNGRSKAEFARYLEIARGSLHELEAHLAFMRAARIAPPATIRTVDDRIRHVEQLIAGLLKSLTHQSSK